MRYVVVILGMLGSLAPLATAQEPADTAQRDTVQALKVFLDCQNFFCDFDHFRREIPFVNWMRDQRDADVHVLGTAQSTGGGREFTFNFIGRRRFAGRQDTLVYNSSTTDTRDEIREGQTRTLALGLVRYVAGTPLARQIDIRYTAEEGEQQAAARPEDDPWNFWLFRVRAFGSLNGESRQRSYFINGGITANRTTEALKVNLSVSGFYNRSEFEFDDGTEFVNTTKNIRVRELIVWSLGSRWAAGVQSSATSATFVNQDLTLRAGPAIEFNIYPYAESTRRQITFLYSANVVSFDFEERTLFDRTSEVRGEHRLELAAEIQQPWGEVDGSVEARQFLHDLSKHRIDVRGGIELRIFRGFNLDVSGSVSRIKDQIFLPAEGLSDEDILLRRRQLGTDFQFRMSVGFSYTFGSIFNNVVNPRMDGFFF